MTYAPSKKQCCYKGCGATNHESSEVFFQFPKDHERYRLWVELSKCEEVPIKGTKFLCSKHFDHKKYMSTNPRRKLLLHTALPYAHQSDSEDDVEVESTQFEEVNEEYFIQGVIEDEPETKENIMYRLAESTNEETANYEDQELPNHHLQEKKSSERDDLKRKKEIKDKPQGSSTIVEKKIKSDTDEHQVTIEYPSHSEQCEEELINNPNVTTFIFKGEEYVQMPKSLYVQEKLELLAGIQYYKDIVAKMKRLMDSVKDGS